MRWWWQGRRGGVKAALETFQQNTGYMLAGVIRTLEAVADVERVLIDTDSPTVAEQCAEASGRSCEQFGQYQDCACSYGGANDQFTCGGPVAHGGS